MNPKQMLPVPYASVDVNSPAWQAWFQGAYAAAFPQGGTTAQRPANPQIYQPYFDTTLGFIIHCRAVTPAVVWVDGTGTPV